jgi:hypothetical protein
MVLFLNNTKSSTERFEARWDIPEASNAGFQTSRTDNPSGFVNNRVSTSFGFASKKFLTILR